MVLPRLALLALLARRVGALVPTLRRPAAQRAVARALDDDIFAEMGGGDALFPASADDALGHPDHDYLRDDDGSCAVDLDAVNGLLAFLPLPKRQMDHPKEPPSKIPWFQAEPTEDLIENRTPPPTRWLSNRADGHHGADRLKGNEGDSREY